MIKSIKAKFSKGMIEPLERIDLEEGRKFKVSFKIGKEPNLSLM